MHDATDQDDPEVPLDARRRPGPGGLLARLRGLLGLDGAATDGRSIGDVSTPDGEEPGFPPASSADWEDDGNDEPRLDDARLIADIEADATPEDDPVSPALAGLLPALWGDGFSSPGGADFTLYLSQPLALTPQVNLLDPNAGLGGAARLFADRFGVWVDGRETSPRLARKAAEAARLAGLGRKAAIVCVGPGHVAPPLRVGFYDAAYVRDLVFRTVDKEELLDRLDRSLVSRGEILAVDFVRPDTGSSGDAFARWQASERPRPEPWRVADWRAAAAARGWELRLCQDVSDRYRSVILRDLARFVGTLERGRLARPEATALLGEVELWARRVAAMEEGSLRAYRLFAITGR